MRREAQWGTLGTLGGNPTCQAREAGRRLGREALMGAYITSHLKGESISIAGACIRFGRAGSGSDFDTDQSRIVYLTLTLISHVSSIWCA